MKVLIVDDEPLFRIGIKSSVKWPDYGIEIVGEAADGEEALKLITELVPDIVILDIKIPKIDGIGILKRLRQAGFIHKRLCLAALMILSWLKKR